MCSERPNQALQRLKRHNDFLATLIDTFEKRFLTGDPPDIDALREADTFRIELNEAVVELVHIAHQVGVAIEKGDLEEKTVADLRDSARNVDELADEISRERANE